MLDLLLLLLTLFPLACAAEGAGVSRQNRPPPLGPSGTCRTQPLASLPAGFRSSDGSPPQPQAQRAGGRREAGARRERVGLGRAEARPQPRPRGGSVASLPREAAARKQSEGPGRPPFRADLLPSGCFINKNVQNPPCRSMPVTVWGCKTCSKSLQALPRPITCCFQAIPAFFPEPEFAPRFIPLQKKKTTPKTTKHRFPPCPVKI